MQNDLISREFSVKALREYAEQKHTVGQTELANGILKAINFLQKEENVPTAYDVEKVVAELENLDEDERCDNVPQGICDKMKSCKYCRTQGLINIVRNGGKE